MNFIISAFTEIFDSQPHFGWGQKFFSAVIFCGVNVFSGNACLAKEGGLLAEQVLEEDSKGREPDLLTLLKPFVSGKISSGEKAEAVVQWKQFGVTNENA